MTIHELAKSSRCYRRLPLLEKYPASNIAAKTVEQARKETHQIIHGGDDRLLVVIGPCSIHDPKAALEYAQRIKLMREKYKDTLQIIMRVYFENRVLLWVGKASLMTRI